MKVALFVHCFFPEHFYGTETYTLQLAGNLRALGHDAVVVTAVFPGEPAREDFITRTVYDGVPVVVFDKNRLPHAGIAETYWQESMREPLRRVLREEAPDIVHVTHLINHTAVLLEEAKALGLPLVGTLTDFFGFCYNNKLEAADGTLCAGPGRLRVNCIACYLKARARPQAAGGLRKMLLAPPLIAAGAAAVRAAGTLPLPGLDSARAVAGSISRRPGILHKAYAGYDAMMAASLFLRDAYVANGFRADRFHINRFGVDVDRSPKPRRPPGAPLTVGYVGQLAPHKGVDLLLAAARRMKPGALRVRIHGPEDQDPAYMALLRGLAGPETAFCGTFPAARIAEVMAGFDVLAIPSTWYENSPLVLLNALATHTPVLVSDVQGMTEFIEDGRNGWRFPRGDVAGLAAVLERLVDAPKAVRAAAAHTAYERTTMAMTEEVVQIYEQVRQGGIR